MRRHLRNHNGDRAFACSHCGLTFVRREVWKRHEALHVNPQSTRPRIKPVHRQDSAATSQSTVLATPVTQIREIHEVMGEPSSSKSAAPPMSSDDPQSEPERSFRAPQLSMPFASSSSNGHAAQNQMVQPWQVSSEAAFSPMAMTSTNALFPDLGIESWLDQILTDQAAFTAVMAPQTSPQQSMQSFFWEQTSSGPSSQDAAGCVRLREWLTDKGGRQEASQLDAERFTRCFGAYWNHVDQQYPIIHRPTFATADCPPALLLAMVLVGATVTAVEDDFKWADSTFPLARGLVTCAGFRDPRDQVHLLQAMVIASLAGHAMGQEAQDHAHALVSTALTLSRRANLYEDRGRANSGRAREGDLETQWKQWILDESTRRVGWVILIRDIEYASFFQQLPSRASSPFKLPVDLPCPESCWDAPTADAWSHAVVPGETLAVALKKVIQAAMGSSFRLPAYTEFAQLVLTYGLCALGWDVNRRDLIAPEISKSGPTSLNGFLLRAFTNWVIHPTYPPPRSRKQECLQGSIQDAALLGALELHLNTLHLQVFVGVTEIGTLQPVRPTDWVEASKVMRKWASSDDSGAAVALSAQYLATVIKAEGVMTLNRAWAVYCAFLVCWSFYVMLRTPPRPRDRSTIPTKNDALRCCDALETWARDREDEPSPAQMRALSTQVVMLLSSRQEVMVKAACMLVDRNAVG
ncbi:uncharacterized protein EHS24_009629 [Apiotrichum porosum]|uniref:C2H2-type domain-containing protein n=1 Tax=Apiotrichum porosum TaxID=105984 RepID=A0A427XMA0_9TREE|nr:uncharacterized protein EHS24_009629 [Apiotrichum porosum]RSH79958.1 hypothetical protein EHS24_009629 [Apiotrichum porosum]